MRDMLLPGLVSCGAWDFGAEAFACSEAVVPTFCVTTAGSSENRFPCVTVAALKLANVASPQTDSLTVAALQATVAALNHCNCAAYNSESGRKQAGFGLFQHSAGGQADARCSK
jgi:hypothetical protein